MDVIEARRTAVALVRAMMAGDRQAVATLLDGLEGFDDPVGQLMTLTSLAELAAAALRHDPDAARRLGHLTAHADEWTGGAPMPPPDGS